MKILTWNLGYWQFKSRHEEAWKYICDEIRPDVALLQEVRPIERVLNNGSIVFEKYIKDWGTAVYSGSLPLSRIAVISNPGRVAIASADINNSVVTFVSIHAPIIRGVVFPHLDDIFSELESMPFVGMAVIGGDLNSARLAEKVWPEYGHGPFWDRIDRGDIWVDCCRRFNGVEIQTIFKKGGVNPFQDDHIFVSPSLARGLKSCNVIYNQFTRSVSDHIPLVVEMEITE